MLWYGMVWRYSGGVGVGGFSSILLWRCTRRFFYWFKKNREHSRHILLTVLNPINSKKLESWSGLEFLFENEVRSTLSFSVMLQCNDSRVS